MYGTITSKASNTSITPSLPPTNVTNFTNTKFYQKILFFSLI